VASPRPKRGKEPSTPKRAPEEAPNLLFVFVDQWRAQALGHMGDPNVKTPNLDGLASEGAIFTNAYSTYPLCSPCRASIITGRWPHANGVIRNGILLPDEEVSIAEVLRDMGYRTGYVGKWHLDGKGKGIPGQKGHSTPGGYVPPGWRRQGFEFWAGFNLGHFYWDSHYWRDSPEALDMTGTYEPDYQTDLALQFLEKSHEADRPFYLFVSWGPPHGPHVPPEEYAALYDPEGIELRPNVPEEKVRRAQAESQKYYGMCTNLDDNLKRLMDKLKELGIEDNTVVCFTTDHGDMLGSHGFYKKNRPLDEASHVPLIIRYPRAIQKKEIDSLVSSADIMPTLLSLCGAPIPGGVQGIDLTGLIDGSGGGHPQNSVYMEGWIGKTTEDERGPPDWRAVRKDEYMLTINVGDGTTRYLFDMGADPYQMNNLAGQGLPLEEELRNLLYWWKSGLGDNLWSCPEVNAQLKDGST